MAVPPKTEAFAAMDRFAEELVKAGAFVAGAGLKNAAEAMRWSGSPSASSLMAIDATAVPDDQHFERWRIKRQPADTTEHSELSRGVERFLAASGLRIARVLASLPGPSGLGRP